GFRVILLIKGDHPFVVRIESLIAPFADYAVGLLGRQTKTQRRLRQGRLALYFSRPLVFQLWRERGVELRGHRHGEPATFQSLAVAFGRQVDRDEVLQLVPQRRNRDFAIPGRDEHIIAARRFQRDPGSGLALRTESNPDYATLIGEGG